MSTLAIYQHHERTTTVALEADLQFREIGIDPVLKMLTGYSEVLATKIHAVTQESPAVLFVGTLGSTGNFAINTNKFTVAASSGNTLVAGTLTVSSSVTCSTTLVVTLSATIGTTLSVTGAITVGSTVTVTGTTAFISTGTAGTSRDAVSMQTGGVNRWLFRNSSAAESGANAGSSFQLSARDDAGSGIDNPIDITRAAGGTMTLSRPISMSSTLAVTGNVTMAGVAANQIAYSNGSGVLSGSAALTYNGTTLASTVTISSAQTGSGTSSAFLASSAAPTVTVVVTGAGSNEKNWDIQGGATTLSFRTRTDANASGVDYMVVTRSGTSVSSIAFAADVTLSKSSVGGNSLISVTNSDNTNGSSHAQFQVISGGASGGDAFVRYSISGVTTWSEGIDNSDSDAFVITPTSTPGGAANGLRISTAGAVSIPGTLGVTGVVTFTAAPIFSSVTASQILSVDGSKALTSIATTGSGSVVLATSPTMAGTIIAAAADFSGSVTVAAGFRVGSGSASGSNLINFTLATSGSSSQQAVKIVHTCDNTASVTSYGLWVECKTPALSFTAASLAPLYVAPVTIGVGSSVVALYGLFVNSMTGASSNYAIYTNSGLVRFGDEVLCTAAIQAQVTTDSTSISTGSVIVSGGIGVAKRITLDGGTGKTLRIANAVSNAAVAVTLGSTGPTGSTSGAPQGWMRIDINGTDRYMPFW